MNRKNYDTDYGGSYEGPYVVKTESKEVNEIIECECGSHMIRVGVDTEIYHNSDGSQQVRQDIYFAMFNYGNQKRNLWDRIVIAWKYLKTGKMFSDQLSPSPTEAIKLAEFINNNVIKP